MVCINWSIYSLFGHIPVLFHKFIDNPDHFFRIRNCIELKFSFLCCSLDENIPVVKNSTDKATPFCRHIFNFIYSCCCEFLIQYRNEINIDDTGIRDN